MVKPKLLVFASGAKDGGGSGFRNLVLSTQQSSVLDAEVVGVVSNHSDGGVWKHAGDLGVPFFHFPKPWDANGYREIVRCSGANWVALSGWLKFVRGLDPARTFNIHPGPLPLTAGLHGDQVHEKVFEEYLRGSIGLTAVTMHFIDDGNRYDAGPVFFKCGIPIRPHLNPSALAKHVNGREHHYQPRITNLIVHEEIRWDGKDSTSLVLPSGYCIDKFDG